MGPNYAKHFRATQAHQATLSAQGTVYKKLNQPNQPTTTKKHKKPPNLKCHPRKCTMESEVENIFYPEVAGLRPSSYFMDWILDDWGWGEGITSIRDLVCGAGKWPGQWLTQKGTSHSLVGSSVSLHQLLLWAAVCPCQTSPRAGCASPSHVMSFTNLLIHLANIYWTPPKSQALGIHTWIEHTWPLPSFEAFCKSLGRLFAWVWILVKMQMLWSRPELCAVSSCELSRDFQLQADAECLQGSAPHSRPR